METLNFDWTNAKPYAVIGFVVLNVVFWLITLAKSNKKEDVSHLNILTEIMREQLNEITKIVNKQSTSLEEMAVAVTQLATFSQQESRYQTDSFKELKRNQDSFHSRLDRVNETTLPDLINRMQQIKDELGQIKDYTKQCYKETKKNA